MIYIKIMSKTSYSACAIRPEEVPVCTALKAGNYPQLYSERVKSILETVNDGGLREKVRQTLGSFEERDGYLAQSSPYRLVALQGSDKDSLLQKGNVLVARPRLQIAKQNNPDFMSGFYVDFGLNLVGETGYPVNPVQAEALAKDLRNVGIVLTTPKLVPYSSLMLDINGESPSGLVFKLSEQGRDSAKHSILNTQDFDWNYMPSSNGLFRAYLNWLGWVAGVDGLADSYGDGRVVVETTGEAMQKNFKGLEREATELFDRQRQERDSLISRLKA